MARHKLLVSFLLAACTVFSTYTRAHGSANDDNGGNHRPYQVTPVPAYQFVWPSDTGQGTIMALVDSGVIPGAAAEIAEIRFPPGWQGGPHVHELEIFYVLEGELIHVVNDKVHVLTPGMIGIVRAPDKVIHRTPADSGATALVIWPLGGELDGLADFMERVPLQ